MEPGPDGDVELHERGYWDVGFCTGVGGSGGVGGSVAVWAVEGVLAVVVVMMMVQGVLVEVNCVGVVSGSRSGGFAVVVVLEGFRLMSRSSWRKGFLVLE